MSTHFYRYDTETRYATYGSEETVVTLWHYYVQKETPCGYWIVGGPRMKRRWVSKTAHKRFAYPTQEQALESFLRRKKRQVEIYTSRLEQAKRELAVAQEFAQSQETPCPQN